jgi:predicted RNA-binding Zn-ribbon protein involved in translation (DUF1610 family)
MPAIIFDKSNDQRKDQQFVRHATDNRMAQTEIITTFNGLSAEEFVKRIGKRPVCPKCENIMYRHWEKGDKNHKQGVCPKCGYQGASITLDEYWHEKLHR